MTEKKKNGSGEKTRREFLKDAGLLVGGTAIGSTVLLAACGGGETTVTNTKTVTSTVGAGQTATVTETDIQEVSQFVCPFCNTEFASLSALQDHAEDDHPAEAAEPIWGRSMYPLPGKTADAIIIADEAVCIGCDLCTMACSMKHFGVINKDASNIQVRQPQIPIPKGIPVTCSQCEPFESLCTPACPTTPKSIYYDTETMHMVINNETCLGAGCLLCIEACTSKAVRFNAAVSDKPFVCDLCDTENTGNRDPECVKICYRSALFFHTTPRKGRYWFRRSIMEKADMMMQRIYPMTKESLFFPVRNWEEE